MVLTEACLDPFLQPSSDHRSCQQDEDEHVVQLGPQLGKEAGLLRRCERIEAIPEQQGLVDYEGILKSMQQQTAVASAVRYLKLQEGQSLLVRSKD
jgi:hypothetical protein